MNISTKFEAMLRLSNFGKVFRQNLTDFNVLENSSVGRKGLGTLLLEQPILNNSLGTATGTIHCTLNFYDGCTPDFDF